MHNLICLLIELLQLPDHLDYEVVWKNLRRIYERSRSAALNAVRSLSADSLKRIPLFAIITVY